MTLDIEAELRRVSEQEQVLRFTRFDTETAWSIGCRLRDAAREAAAPVAIDVSRTTMQLFAVAMPGASPDNQRWIRRKRNTVLHFLRSSYGVGLSLRRHDVSLAEKFALPDEDYAAHGGSFPIHVEGAGIIGTVTVSGLPQRDDHAMVVAALAAELGYDGDALRLSE